MGNDLPSWRRRLTWCLRTYAWTVAACVLVLASAPLIIAPATPIYQAESLVIARQLTVNPRALPSLGDAIFNAGGVAARVAAADPVITGDPDTLVPGRLSVVAAEDSIVLTVSGRSPDAGIAAQLANLGAAAFVTELNLGGAGVGVFAQQTEATVPTAPTTAIAAPTRAAIGAVAGWVLGLGLIAVIAAVRRPVITDDDARSAVGVPLLGTVRLPRMAVWSLPGPLGVPGIASVGRRLASVPPGRLLLIGPAKSTPLRNRITVMLGVTLWTLRSTRVEGPPILTDAVRELCREHQDAGRPVHPRRAGDGELVLVDGGSSLDILDPAAAVSVVAVAPQGISRSRLRALTADYPGPELVGVVLVEALPGVRTQPRRQRPATTPPSGDQPAPAVAKPVPEPERA